MNTEVLTMYGMAYLFECLLCSAHFSEPGIQWWPLMKMPGGQQWRVLANLVNVAGGFVVGDIMPRLMISFCARDISKYLFTELTFELELVGEDEKSQ